MKLRNEMAAIAVLCLVSVNTASAGTGALANYRGDWMIDGNRKDLVATRWNESSGTLEMHYSYSRSNCFRRTRKAWIMRHDPATHTYSAIIRGRATETAIGRWDEATSTMTWMIETDGENDTVAKPLGKRRIVHVFGDRNAKWTTQYMRTDGTKTTSRPMILDIIVPYDVPKQ